MLQRISASALSTRSTPAARIAAPCIQQPAAPLPPSAIAQRGFHGRVLEHYASPHNVGSMPQKDPRVATGLWGSPTCGDLMKFQIKVDPRTNIIKRAKFKSVGCGSAIAAASYLTTVVHNMSIADAALVPNTRIAKELHLPIAKLHCSRLAEDALKAAIKNYEERRASMSEEEVHETLEDESVERDHFKEKFMEQEYTDDVSPPT